MSRVVDMTHQVVGKLTVIRQVDSIGVSAAWLCRCSCGTEKIFTGAGLRKGDAKSCGCRASVVKHGHSRKIGQSPEYKAFADAIQRCENKNHAGYRLYGARGITFDSAWRDSFETFLTDMGPRPSCKHSLDRKDPYGPYTATNCRWAVPSVQSHNKRAVSNTGILNVTFDKKYDRYQWSIKRNGVRLFGRTKSIMDAECSRNLAEKALYPEQGQYCNDDEIRT